MLSYISLQVWKKEDSGCWLSWSNSTWAGERFLAKSHRLHSFTVPNGLLHNWKYRLPICADVRICWASAKATRRINHIIFGCSKCLASWFLGPIRKNLENVDNLLLSTVHPDVSVFQVCSFSYCNISGIIVWMNGKLRYPPWGALDQ